MVLSDKLESLIVSFNPNRNAFNHETTLDLLSLANYIKTGQNRYKRVRKTLMDKIEMSDSNTGDMADYIGDEIDKLVSKHLSLK